MTAEMTNEQASSLSTDAARTLATTTKSVPQMQGISSRWLLRVLPWTEVAGGTYRVNRRLSYTIGDGRIDCVTTGARARVIPQELGELPFLRDYADERVLTGLADRFVQLEWEPGEMLVEPEQEVDKFYVLAHGKVDRIGAGKYGAPVSLGILSDGAYFGEQALVDEHGVWEFGFKAVTRCVVLALSRQAFAEVADRTESMREHLRAYLSAEGPAADPSGEAEIAMAAGHVGEPVLPTTYVAYETSPREYELSVAQTVLRVHSRVADLYNEPMNQVQQQLRLTVEALRERQEHEIINNRDFGLLHNAEFGQRLSSRTGPPTPDDLDDLLSIVWKDPGVFLAHPHAIAAFGRECSKRGLYPSTVELLGREVPAWRGIPILTCNKIPISDTGSSSMILMRTGEAAQGVVGLHQTGLPDEYEPGLNVRFMGVNEQAIISYLVSAYYSAAVLVPDALGVLENIELGHGG